MTDSFSEFPCFLRLWQFWGRLVRCFVEGPTVALCLMFSPWVDKGYGFWEKRTQRQNVIVTTSYQEYTELSHHCWSLLLMVTLTIWPGLSLSATPPHLLHSLLLGRSHNAKPHTMRINNYTPPTWRHIIYISYFYFFCIGYLCILPLLHHYHSSIYSVIYLHLYKCMDIDFIP